MSRASEHPGRERFRLLLGDIDADLGHGGDSGGIGF